LEGGIIHGYRNSQGGLNDAARLSASSHREDGGTKDLFVQHSGIGGEGAFKSLSEGAKVE
jgi:hypothetical protein